ncbi:MAG: hypothetical protein M0R06_17560 [Sphaerochaeta sp.]|jgi:hypothetical protein|nr:hypothetical protein [Sphaerochaeta sp.]
MSIESVQDYIAAKEALRAGDREEATRLLVKSMGAEAPTQIIERNLETLLGSHEVALTLVLNKKE